ncbi:hypothetical protein SUGI_0250020 [Cryptomeria japonica]|uniref:uncharacterized protein LOC131067211 n=1 Tax=Cryptomeria japonica TaxID=3369 RepID=UPI002408CA4A|nr:uncharacterized protein LOC131067211 [Cryptomeria japonica]GLJ15280.1 hypothetical protein SUGI_0250020 [Cryptomeria japonica]
MSYSPEERFLAERVKRSVDQVQKAVEQQLSGVQDHVNFNLQKAYFKCAYDCFDRQRNQQEISNCVEYCSVPVVQANNAIEEEMSRFQERLRRSLMVCQDRLEATKFINQKDVSHTKEFESCVDQTIKEQIQLLPHVVDRLKLVLSKSGNL